MQRAERFDLSKVFAKNRGAADIDVHLYFVKLFGCKLRADAIPVDLSSFSRALMERRAHPEVRLFVADGHIAPGQILAYDSDVSRLSDVSGRVDSALWMYLMAPVAIKVNYLRAGSPLKLPPGTPWHPTQQRKNVYLSPYRGDSEPIPGLARLTPDT